MTESIKQSITIIKYFGFIEFIKRSYRVFLLHIIGQGAYQKPLINTIRKLSQGFNVFIDIGAANGEIVAGVNDLFKKSLAFEPANHHLKVLKKKNLKNVIVLDKALGDKKKKVKFGISSTNPDDNIAYVRDDVSDYVIVEQLMLDSVIADMKLTGNACLIKIDVQGYEYYVFKGAKKLLDSGVTIISEYWPWGMSRAGVTAEMYFDLLDAAGYQAHELNGKPVSKKRMLDLYNKGIEKKYIVFDVLLSKKSFQVVSNGYIDSPSQALRDYLAKNGHPTRFIIHPLLDTEFIHSSTMYQSSNGYSEWKKKRFNKPPYTYVFDWFIPIKEKYSDVYVGFNNYAALKGIVLRKLKKTSYVVYWAVDFVPNRFGKGLMTKIYDAMDKFVCTHADLRVDLSEAALSARAERHGIKDKDVDKLVVPMGAWLSRTPKTNVNAWKKKKIVYMGYLVERQGVDLALEALKIIRDSGMDATMDVVGTGPLLPTLKNKSLELGLKMYINFHGFVEDHKDLEKIIASGAVAVAPYRNTVENFTQFADPGKLKAYLGANLPLVITKVPPNALDLKKEGAAIIVDDNPKSIATAVTSILKDEKTWKNMNSSSKKMSSNFDWDKLLAEFLTKIDN